MSADPAFLDHQAWLGYLQPDGLVVAPAALVDAQAVLDRAQFSALQEKLAPFVGHTAPRFGEDKPLPAIIDLPAFLRGFLDWPPECLATEIPDALKLALSEGETLAPDFAFRETQPADPERPWLLLIQQIPASTDLDARSASDARGWNASPAQRFERLLRGVEVPIGLLSNGTHLRLLYAPRGENAGSLTFPVAAMAEIAGRPILAAFHLLLSRYRLLAAPREGRLPALLQRSRDYQASVSTALAGQVLEALYELLRGFEHAHTQSDRQLLARVLAERPDDLYGALLTVLMRLVFVLFAEDRDLLPASELYRRGYSVHGLFERLRADAELYPDTLDLRYGAWTQLCVLFRLVHAGCKHPRMAMPARRGHLFDPDRFPFLESASASTPSAPPQLPLVPDGTLYRVLEKLLLLDGERLSYRTLDVEEIGSVYQTVMGFRLEIARGRTIALTGKRKHKSEVAAPIAIDLDALLAVDGKERGKWLKEHAAHELTGAGATALKQAASVEDLLVVLDRRIARGATPHLVHPGGLLLQPTDERRRSGSHYTPRALTEPIVRKTLAPILQRLGAQPTPPQILELKVCDMAVGSGAFLVETCRQLGDALVVAWGVHGGRPPVPPDEDELLLARRLVAQRCLYGVDRNPMAVDLAKLSLWLATLARDHPFTFLDHALRGGDSLVGLSRRQLSRFHWDDTARIEQFVFGQDELEKIIARVSKFRREILDGGDDMLPELKRQKLALADEELVKVRRAGDLCIRAFFEADSARARNARRDEALSRFGEAAAAGRKGDMAGLLAIQNDVAVFRGDKPGDEKPVTPFHWEIEFPEVIDRENSGFDAFVSNPPFMGGTKISEVSGMAYFQWLVANFSQCQHHCDLVAYFFRNCFRRLRRGGCFGMIATNTIAQGDTREGGLSVIVKDEGQIYDARRRYRWPGMAAVIVSVIHVAKNHPALAAHLDGKQVSRISAYLLDGVVDDSPAQLGASPFFSLGCKIYGQGFLFADDDPECTPIAEYHAIIDAHPAWAGRVLPYIGGEELNTNPLQKGNRYAINFSDVETADELDQWPELRDIVAQKVRPEREKLGNNPNNVPLKKRWWAYQAHRPELYQRLAIIERTVARSRIGNAFAFAFLPSRMVLNEKVVVFPYREFSFFALVQSRVHEIWAVFFSSTLKDDLQYTASACFETFPFPTGWETDAALEAAGREYYEHRAALMVRHDEGLTTTYNRFHTRDERNPDLMRLRELHAQMDRAVLAAYGWSDLPTACEFIPDYFEEDASGEPVAKSIRYRWPDAIRDEVFARLLKLNAERAEQERLLASAAEEKPKKRKPAAKVPKATKTQLQLGVPTLAKGERALPDELRLPAPEPLLYTTTLVLALLSEAGGALPWQRLLDAYTLATNPALMRRHCPPDEASRVATWAARWNEQVTEGLLLPSIEQLGGRNLMVTNDNDGRVFHLLDGPRRTRTEADYDAWLALRIATPLASETIDIPEREAWTEEANELVLA